ncbi:GNAT family N-acetyltransferase [Ferruginibacter paludis]|uniref:GNAT family N-acetyltransferase n=1 Tax=Ferruginibacter paludis TaxID=1310417 RepID=UPI0025B34082|nr:GNAT family N-acetyltransferase [Ferruginibacter paludis]MDN3654480.1 GNAT family N-acetyltransferase [Ferruginibacter paludis]
MITIKRTSSDDSHFRELVQQLDADLKIRDGDEHAFYAQFNKAATIKYALVAYDGDVAVGSGAIRELNPDTMEVKRMFVLPACRGKGIASALLQMLETWSVELGYKKCVLETGKNQPEAIALYKKSSYKIIPNYGQYQSMINSVCFEKELVI